MFKLPFLNSIIPKRPAKIIRLIKKCPGKNHAWYEAELPKQKIIAIIRKSIQ